MEDVFVKKCGGRCTEETKGAFRYNVVLHQDKPEGSLLLDGLTRPELDFLITLISERIEIGETNIIMELSCEVVE